MKDLLIHVYQVLTSDPSLTTAISTDNIGAVVRQPTGTPALEYGIDGEESDAGNHRKITLSFQAYSQTGAEEVYRLKDLVEGLMTAVKLSTPVPPATQLTFKVLQSRLADSRVLPRNEWAFSIRFEFTLKVADLRTKTQKQ